MFTTRSTDQTEPATRASALSGSLILCTHGSRSEGKGLSRLVRSLSERLPAWEVSSCCLYGRPQLEEVIAKTNGPRLILVPFLMAEGLTFEALRKRVEALTDPRALILREPVGTHSALAAGLLAMAEDYCRSVAWAKLDTALLLIAHGTGRHPGGHKAMEVLVRMAGESRRFGETRLAFLEEKPGIADALAAITAPRVVALGCFAEAGTHGACDVPQALKGDRRPVAYLGSIGEAPWIEEIVMRRAFEEKPSADKSFKLQVKEGEVHATG